MLLKCPFKIISNILIFLTQQQNYHPSRRIDISENVTDMKIKLYKNEMFEGLL